MLHRSKIVQGFTQTSSSTPPKEMFMRTIASPPFGGPNKFKSRFPRDLGLALPSLVKPSGV